MHNMFVDWNLEIAHVSWASPEAPSSIEEALENAKEYIDEWRKTDSTFTICSLVDDKEMRVSDRGVWLREVQQDYPQLFGLLDYVCFESDLIRLKEEFLAQIEQHQRGRISREIDRYRKRHGRVACSHDIAIWHLLRMGQLPSANTIIHVLSKRQQGLSSLFARSVLSILEEEDQEPEKRAHDILKFCSDHDVINRIECIYYA